MRLSSGETVPPKWRPCQDEIMTRTEATVKNQEKTNQNTLKVLQLTNVNTNKFVTSNLLKPIQRDRKLIDSKVEECQEITATAQVLQIGRRDDEDAIEDWSLGIQEELGKYEKV